MIPWTSLKSHFYDSQCNVFYMNVIFFFLHCEDLASCIAQGCGAMAVVWGNTDELTHSLTGISSTDQQA